LVTDYSYVIKFLVKYSGLHRNHSKIKPRIITNRRLFKKNVSKIYISKLIYVRSHTKL